MPFTEKLFNDTEYYLPEYEYNYIIFLKYPQWFFKNYPRKMVVIISVAEIVQANCRSDV